MMTGVLFALVYFVWNLLLVPILILLLIFFPDASHLLSIHFFEGFIEIPEFLFPIFFVLAFVLTGGGVYFFVLGGLELAKHKIQRQELTQSSVYRIIRHPQNLGLIVLGFSLMIFIFQTWLLESSMVRIGDIYSWLLFSLILLIEAKWEEEQLVAKLGVQYLTYQNEVPFMIPFGKKVEVTLLSWLNPNWSFKKRILMWLGMYISFLIVSAFLIVFFDLAYWFK